MKKLIGMIATIAFIVGCSSDDDKKSSSSTAATKPTTVLTEISSKAESAGTAIGNALIKESSLFSVSNIVKALDVDARCNENGAPIALDEDYNPITETDNTCTDNDGHVENGECLMTAAHPEYPGQRAYCLLAKNTGNSDTVLGSFELVKSLICALEHSGITWHSSKPSSADNVTITFDDNCFASNQLDDICDGDNSCDVPGTVKAYLNPDSYYDSRFTLSVDFGGNDVTIDGKLKVSSTISEIAINTIGINDTNQFDAFAAKYDSAKNAFTFEGRFDRIDTSSGWSRHIRVYADLDNSAVLMPEKVEVAYANLYKNGPNVDDYGTELVTLRGSMMGSPVGMTGEVYGKYGVTLDSAVNISDNPDPSRTQTVCYLPDDETTTAQCQDVDPIDVPIGELGFFLPGTGYRQDNPADYHEYQDNSKWFENLLGISFTSIDLEDTEP